MVQGSSQAESTTSFRTYNPKAQNKTGQTAVGNSAIAESESTHQKRTSANMNPRNSNLPQVKEAITAMIEKEKSAYCCHDYLGGSNVEVTADDRRQLVDWCFALVDRCSFQRETVAIATNLLDRFLSVPSKFASIALQDQRELQLLAMTSLYIAIKTNERVAFSSQLLSAASHGGYTIEEIEDTEKLILYGLGWRINGPTPLQMALHILSLMQVGKIILSESLTDLLNEVQYQTEVVAKDYNMSIQRSSTITLIILFKTFQQFPHDTRIQLFTSLLTVLQSFDFDSTCKRLIASCVLESEVEFEQLSTSPVAVDTPANSCNM